MDFDIGNILYIIITLVAVLIGVLGKKKKQAQDGSGAPAGETRTSFMENLERVLTMGQEQAQIRSLQDFEQDLPVEEYGFEEPEPDFQAEIKSDLSLMEEYERLNELGREINPDQSMQEKGILDEDLKVIDLEEESGTDYFEIARNFDAGTAIVYSAIINRLDY